jgi:hypothetical protein
VGGQLDTLSRDNTDDLPSFIMMMKAHVRGQRADQQGWLVVLRYDDGEGDNACPMVWLAMVWSALFK